MIKDYGYRKTNPDYWLQMQTAIKNDGGLSDLEKKESLKEVIGAYYQELKDQTARNNAKENKAQTTSLAETEQLRKQFEMNYDEKMLKNVRDSSKGRNGMNNPEVKKYQRKLAQVNEASKSHGLPTFKDVTA